MPLTRLRPFAAACAIAALLGPALTAQNTVHVAPWGDDASSGFTNAAAGPHGAKRTLQAAIDAVATGGVVQVAPGTYAGPGNRDLDVNGRALTLRGAGASQCTIDCGGSAAEPHRALWFHSGESIATVIEGFTITSGSAGFGGAILIEGGSSPTLRNCVFTANTASPTTTGGEGGAVRCVGGAPQLTNCRFEDNRALRIAGVGGRGGAIQFIGGSTPVVTDCQFLRNDAGGGGGVHSTGGTVATLTRCLFEANSTHEPTFNGGGGYLGSAGGHHTFVDCRFVENETARIAGALWMTQATAATIVRCEFLRNHGFDGGSVGVSSGSVVTIRDSLFAGNSADIFGAALDVFSGLGAAATATVVNCTFADNTASTGYGAIVVSHTSQVLGSNNVVWGNGPVAIRLLDSAAATLSWSDVEGGWPGLGNLAIDPVFAGSGRRPYALTAGSPCVDAGDPGFVSPTMRDLAGAGRIRDGNGDTTSSVDMGCYELGGVPGDLDDDGVVTAQDLLILTNHIGMTALACWVHGDLDGDTDVDAVDLVRLLQALGSSRLL